MDEFKLQISPLTAVAIVCLAIASYVYNPTPSQIGTVAGAALGGVVMSAFVSHPIGMVAGALAGSVAGYKFSNESN